LNLVPGQVGVNEIGQEFLWNDKILYQTNRKEIHYRNSNLFKYFRIFKFSIENKKKRQKHKY
jgi:hypothetical protein